MTGTISQDGLSLIRSYWERLRAGRVAPYRSELDPRQFDAVLENVFILEQLNPQQLRVRLAGLRLCELMGLEVRGMPPEAMIEASDRAMFVELLSDVLKGPFVGELDLLVNDTAGRALNSEMVLLPMRSDFGEVTRILGCVTIPDGLSYPPVSFSIAEQRLVPVKVTDTQSKEPELAGFAEEVKPFKRKPSSQPPKLRSVAGNPDALGPRGDGTHLRVIK
ncbi:MAG: PAS domain-containing protein [Pseudomonadota bacterium]